MQFASTARSPELAVVLALIAPFYTFAWHYFSLLLFLRWLIG
jgi:hypothetical protein